ncbi:hypothetical protein T492DRAFT_437659 [Pavlovales sp. CCMP2436]|nr:hypothetical protein T492DRAFT_437659 [Pavlovales sp. CCMP2436]
MLVRDYDKRNTHTSLPCSSGTTTSGVCKYLKKRPVPFAVSQVKLGPAPEPPDTVLPAKTDQTHDCRLCVCVYIYTHTYTSWYD